MRRGGFTLIEVLVAVVILATVCTAALKLVILSQNTLAEVGERERLLDETREIEIGILTGELDERGTSGDIRWETEDREVEMFGEDFGRLDLEGLNFDGAARCMSDLVSMGEEPLMILGAVSWQMRRLYALRLAQEEGLGRDFAVSCTGLKSDFAYKKAAASARRFTLEGLRRAVELCVETDYAMKSSGGSAQERLNELLLRLAVECL